MSDLRDQIAATLLTHQHVGGKCLCQNLREQTTSGQHAKHVADAVIRELGLKKEWLERPHSEERDIRWVTDWMPDDLRTRIAAVLKAEAERRGIYKIADFDFPFMADAVIRELNGEFLDFALWLSEEITGKPLSRIDAESCLKDWKEVDE